MMRFQNIYAKILGDKEEEEEEEETLFHHNYIQHFFSNL